MHCCEHTLLVAVWVFFGGADLCWASAAGGPLDTGFLSPPPLALPPLLPPPAAFFPPGSTTLSAHSFICHCNTKQTKDSVKRFMEWIGLNWWVFGLPYFFYSSIPCPAWVYPSHSGKGSQLSLLPLSWPSPELQRQHHAPLEQSHSLAKMIRGTEAYFKQMTFKMGGNWENCLRHTHIFFRYH